MDQTALLGYHVKKWWSVNCVSFRLINKLDGHHGDRSWRTKDWLLLKSVVCDNYVSSVQASGERLLPPKQQQITFTWERNTDEMKKGEDRMLGTKKSVAHVVYCWLVRKNHSLHTVHAQMIIRNKDFHPGMKLSCVPVLNLNFLANFRWEFEANKIIVSYLFITVLCSFYNN